MILHADRQIAGRRYSIGLVGSLLFHVLLAGVLIWGASVALPAGPFDPSGGSGRYAPRHAAALVRAGSFGGEPTGTDGRMRQPLDPAAAWPVRQVQQLQLRLAIRHVIDHVWQSTLFALAIGLLTLAFRRNRARVRYALWFSVSAKFLVPFSVLIWLGSAIASTAAAAFDSATPTDAAGSLAGSSGPVRALLHTAWSLLDSLGRHPLVGGIGTWLTETGSLLFWPSTVTISEVTAAWLGLALVAIWTCGFVAIIFSRSRLSGQVWDLARTARRVELIDVQVPARLQVGLCDDLLAPGVIGWFRPVLLLPADIERHLTRPEIEAIVAHELCHVRRFDNMTAAIHMLVEAIFWFHPLVWWLGARLVDERERACDEHVVRTLGTPGPYAQGILNICKRYVSAPVASVSGVGSANVRQRIDAILTNRIGEATGLWKQVLLSGGMLCMVVVPLAAGALQTSPSRATSYALVLARADGALGPGLRGATINGSTTNVPATNVPTADGSTRNVRGVDGARLHRPRVVLGEIAADAMTVSQLSTALASVLGHDVEDRTGLSGEFIVRLNWTTDARGTSLFTAVEQQLGLRLVPLPSRTQ